MCTFAPGAGNIVSAGVGLGVGITYYVVTDVVSYKGKSLTEWTKEGAGNLADKASATWNSCTSWIGN